MGGATEDDEAMKWFLRRANGGDVLVLRTSGSDGYNNYMYAGLGVNVNSVETIVFSNGTASNESYVRQKIAQAEAIWFAGGDQWNYVTYWRGTPVDSLINAGIQNRGLVVGGTSAGMAILGGYYFTAQNGTVSSANALANPYYNTVTVDSAAFIESDYLQDVITDTHYDDPDRRGRHVTFLSRIFEDYGVYGKGIACDEYTAVCIDTSGIAHVYGGFPTYDDNAYFIQSNCELPDASPENCSAGNPLDWNRGGAALKVYHIKGTSSGAKTFDLNDWETGQGGTWQHWSAQNGTFQESAGTPINCLPTTFSAGTNNEIECYPNPFRRHLKIQSGIALLGVRVVDLTGKEWMKTELNSERSASLDLSELPVGMYFVVINSEKGIVWRSVLKAK